MAYDPRAAGALCDVCVLCGPGKAPKCVPSIGPSDARLAFVGEGPGVNEVKRGEPMVGAAGIKFDEVLYAAGLKRREVFITNASLCRLEVPDENWPDRYSAESFMKWFTKMYGKPKKPKKQKKGAPPPEPAAPVMLDPFAACKPRLLRELHWLDTQARAAGAPNGVVPMPLGNYALRVLRGVTGILKYRGSVMLPIATDFSEIL